MLESEIELQKYGEYRPTTFDPPGLHASDMGHDDDDCDRSEWLVVSVGQTRDSGPLDQSNFASAEKAIETVDKDGTDHETHRFGHWGPGWFEIIIVRPDTAAHREAQSIAAALSDYPVLDDDDLSARECAAEDESWESWARRDMIEEMAKLADIDTDAFDDVSDDDLRQLVYVEQNSDGPSFMVDVRGYRNEKVTAAHILALPGLVLDE